MVRIDTDGIQKVIQPVEFQRSKIQFFTDLFYHDLIFFRRRNCKKYFKNNEYEINIYMLESQNLDCTYEEIIKKYCKKYRLENLLTTETNKLYSITYKIALKEDITPLTIIGDLNNQNQNLSISFKHIEKEDSIL